MHTAILKLRYAIGLFLLNVLWYADKWVKSLRSWSARVLCGISLNQLKHRCTPMHWRYNWLKLAIVGILWASSMNIAGASAEPIFVGSFPSYAASSTKTFPLTGALPPGHELRQLQIVTEANISCAAATNTVAAADHQTIFVALYNRFRMSFYGQNDVYSLDTKESRTIAVYATGRDPAPQGLRTGTVITTTPTAYKLKAVIPFTVRGLDYPEVFAPSTDQGNLPNTKLDYDSLGTALTTVTIGGTANNTITVTDVKVFAMVAPVVVSHAGPLMFWRSKTVTQNTDTETGMALDLFVADERAPATVEVQAAQISIVRDMRMSPRNVSPTNIALHYGETQFPIDGVLPLDITNNSTGFQVTPSIWIGGDIRSTEWQWPIWVVQRQYLQTLAGGGSPNATLLFWQVRPVTEVQQQLVQLVNQFQLGVTSLDQLAVRGGGGGDNDVNKLFKGRYMQAAA